MKEIAALSVRVDCSATYGIWRGHGVTSTTIRPLAALGGKISTKRGVLGSADEVIIWVGGLDTAPQIPCGIHGFHTDYTDFPRIPHGIFLEYFLCEFRGKPVQNVGFLESEKMISHGIHGIYMESLLDDRALALKCNSVISWHGDHETVAETACTVTVLGPVAMEWLDGSQCSQDNKIPCISADEGNGVAGTRDSIVPKQCSVAVWNGTSVEVVTSASVVITVHHAISQVPRCPNGTVTWRALPRIPKCAMPPTLPAQPTQWVQV
ncbi:hypothetical protein BD779DRAFT_1480065 [Infundibulicybe gibba]|nr:hypothetical protein BD779DRAFT_1480065 [Infundibulicybe gibba]